MKPDCAKCAHRLPLMQGAKTVGLECRRNPPVGFIATVQVVASPEFPDGVRQVPGSLWPPVKAGQFCGEFTPQADLVKPD